MQKNNTERPTGMKHLKRRKPINHFLQKRKSQNSKISNIGIVNIGDFQQTLKFNVEDPSVQQ